MGFYMSKNHMFCRKNLIHLERNILWNWQPHIIWVVLYIKKSIVLQISVDLKKKWNHAHEKFSARKPLSNFVTIDSDMQTIFKYYSKQLFLKSFSAALYTLQGRFG